VSPDRRGLWEWRVSLAVGVVALIVGAVLLVRTVQFVAEAEHATGTVVDMSRERDSEGDVSFHPVVRFRTAQGDTIVFVSSYGSSSPSESPGDRVEVLYDPDDPSDAKLSGLFQVWLFPAVVLLIGASSIGTAWYRRRRVTRGPSEADIEWLRAHGRQVKGGSPRVVHDDSLEIQGSSPFLVEVDVHDPVRDEVRVLTSAHVWFDPAPYIADREALDVYIDPERGRALLRRSLVPAPPELAGEPRTPCRWARLHLQLRAVVVSASAQRPVIVVSRWPGSFVSSAGVVSPRGPVAAWMLIVHWGVTVRPVSVRMSPASTAGFL
jgi:hypothetical protein